jgi:leader peptidase (prepilin peptidase)/N-methyltransferase
MPFHFFVGFLIGAVSMLFFLWHAKGESVLADAVSLKALVEKKWLVALMSGLFFGGLFSLNAFVFPGRFLFFDVLSVLLIFSALYDLLFRLIPLPLMLSIVVFVLSSSFFFSILLPSWEALWGGGIVGGVVLLLYLVSKGRGIGEADVLLAFILGFLFGWDRGLLVFSAANFLGLLVILPLIVLLGKERMKQVPLVLFIVIAVLFEFYFDYSGALLHWLQLA